MRSNPRLLPIRYAGFVAFAVFAVLARGMAGDQETDVKRSREVVVGTTRVVLLKVNRLTEFTDGEEGKPPRIFRSLQVVFLREDLEKPVESVNDAAAVFAAGTMDRPLRGADRTRYQTDLYPRKLPDKSTLPKVSAADRAVISTVTFEGELTTKQVDLSLRIGLRKGDDRRVLFKNIPLE